MRVIVVFYNNPTRVGTRRRAGRVIFKVFAIPRNPFANRLFAMAVQTSASYRLRF